MCWTARAKHLPAGVKMSVENLALMSYVRSIPGLIT